jgi:PBSX family phage terminase large subunit
MSYVIEYAPDLEQADYTPYGGNEELMYSHEAEVLVEGPAETGKTLAACWKSHLICSKYPGAQGAILRKTQASIYGSVLQTFQRVIDGAPVVPYGGEKPEKYIYPNGSTVWIGGMDNRDRVLSSERDFIQTCQTEEFSVDDWEYLTTRTTGRGAVIPYPQLYGDCNPGGSLHWIKQRNKAGHLRLIRTTHRDNPTLYNRDGSLTKQGKKTMARLSALTGVRRKRLYEGIWATAEGAIYDNFDVSVHVKTRPLTDFKTFYLAIDEGYTNPAVILLVGEDSDGRLHIIAEFYERGKLQSAVVEHVKAWTLEYGVSVAAVDEAAAGLIADLLNNNVPARSSKGRVLDGINKIQNRLNVLDDGLPRLTIEPSCLNIINEFESYVWKKVTTTGVIKDEPQKENDHAMDAIRYLDNLIDTTRSQLLDITGMDW